MSQPCFPQCLCSLQVYDGYFVHYFAPEELPIVPKEVIFVIDVSGSMSGVKLAQTKEAMHTILNDLQTHDYFNILTFHSSVDIWQKNGTVQATANNIKRAKDFVKRIRDRGCKCHCLSYHANVFTYCRWPPSFSTYSSILAYTYILIPCGDVNISSSSVLTYVHLLHGI